jgi:hypothetical protein
VVARGLSMQAVPMHVAHTHKTNPKCSVVIGGSKMNP